MRKVLSTKFFNRSTISVARNLLGKFLVVRLRPSTSLGASSPQVRRYRGREFAHMITEVEAYDGFNDRGSHASRGKTKRNAPMFGPPGHWYVYFTYGMHWMLNVVTKEKGYPAAILIRGLQGMSGPARLTKKLRIDGKLNGLSASKKSGLWIEDRGIKISSSRVKKSPRVGIAYAGKYWAKKPWRLYLS